MKHIKIITALLLCTFLFSCSPLLRDDGADSSITESESHTSAEIAGGTEEDTSGENADEDTDENTSEKVSSAEDTEEVTEEQTEAQTEKNTEAQTEEKTETLSNTQPTAQYAPKAMMYHLIREDVYGPYEKLFVRPSEFETHLSVLDRLGYEYLFAEEWRMTEKPSVIITLDDGYDDNYSEMFPLLKKHGAKATVFIVSDLVNTDGYLTSAQIKEMSDSGLVSFQCHSAHHRDLSYMTADELRADFTECNDFVKSITGKAPRALAYPAGSYNDTVLAVASEFFDFCYTTKAPSVTPQYTPFTVPRYYIARGYGDATFSSFVKY